MGRIRLFALGLALLAAPLGAQERPDVWRIHEWGTFTALQNENGTPLGWINTEDEPLPTFVHRLSQELIVRVDDLPPVEFKGVARSHPDVTLRLETPVVYFYPPKSATLPAKIDLHVDFRSGWLTEYYPDAKVSAPGFKPEEARLGRLRRNTKGSLDWKDLQIGKAGSFPETKDSVWLSPRRVKSAPVVAANGEAEQFLFYRGVASFEAPIQARRSGDKLELSGNLQPPLESLALKVPRLWLADIREDGRTAFRPYGGVKLQRGRIGQMDAGFADSEYSVARLGELRAEMRAGLIADGLFEDEAEALLNTWDASYFRSHGKRIFFLVPREWTDSVLPLRASVPAQYTRVMIGRLELITAAQRSCLARISATKNPSHGWFREWTAKNPQAAARFDQRRAEGFLGELRAEKIAIPDDYLAYLELGRFRNALLLDELQNRPTEGLRKFVEVYDLEAADVAER